MVLSTDFALIREGETEEKHNNIYHRIKIFISVRESRMNLAGVDRIGM
jgi:hypothetical protein